MMCSTRTWVAQTRLSAPILGVRARDRKTELRKKKGELFALARSKLTLPGDRIAPSDTNLSIDGFGSARFVCVGARRHRNHNVFTLLAVGFGHAQEHSVFVDAELRRFAHGEKRRMLVVFRPDAIDQTV